MARGRKHIAELEVEIAAFLSRDPCVIFLEMDRETRERGIVLRSREPIPDAFTTIFGDAVHNLRVALDLVANDLVSLSGSQPKKVYFPFAESEQGLENQIKEKIRSARPDILDMIRSLKPYRGGNLSLRGLHDLDIIDKHRAVITTGISVATGMIPFKKVGGEGTTGLTFEADFGTFPTITFDNTGYGGVDNERFENLGRLADHAATLRLAVGLPFEGKPPLAVLHHLAKMVDRIIQAFEAHCLGRKQTAPK